MNNTPHLVKTNLPAKVSQFEPSPDMLACQYVAGVDEVGRGPLVGSVVTSAVILAPDHGISGLTDSKTISEKKRENLAVEIREKALAWSIAEAGVEEIDRLNILHATMLAMKRALESLDPVPGYALIDGNRSPDVTIPCQPVVKGDLRVPVISAASILAKVYRDNQMKELDERFPQYGFAQHKGYPTRAHLEALENHGVTEFHRKSYGPVAKLLAAGNN